VIIGSLALTARTTSIATSTTVETPFELSYVLVSLLQVVLCLSQLALNYVFAGLQNVDFVLVGGLSVLGLCELLPLLLDCLLVSARGLLYLF